MEKTNWKCDAMALQALVLTGGTPAGERLAVAMRDIGCEIYLAANLEDLTVFLSGMRYDAVVVEDGLLPTVQGITNLLGNRPRPLVVPAPGLGSSEMLDAAATASAVVGVIRDHLAVDHDKVEQPVNVERFLTMVDCDQDFFEVLAAEFLKDAVVKIPELEKAVAAADYPRVEFLAHSLKSVFGIFGAAAAAASAKELEAAGREGRGGDAVTLLPDLLIKMRLIENQLKAILAVEKK